MVKIYDFPVMKKCCDTCPFKKNEHGRYQNIELASLVISRLLEGSQICHHPRLHGKRENALCRGARDVQLEIMYRLGVIEAPTDEAWRNARLLMSYND